MQEIFSVDISNTRQLRRLITIIHLLALVALAISGLHLSIKLLIATLVILTWIALNYKYIKQRSNYRELAYFDDLASIKNSPATVATSGWRIRNSTNQWINLDLQSSSVFLDTYILLSFSVVRDQDIKHRRQEIIQLPLVTGDLLADNLRALKVFLRFTS
ncbi:MAG: hypothetical protein HAW61_01100 [Candidatus Portiera sp.]|nr:hypothetical protein [Portiera sp.]